MPGRASLLPLGAAGGQADADREHYVALPEPLVRQVEGYWSEAFR